jgi:hypothetical protein
MRTARKIAIVLVALVVMTVGLALPAQAGAEGDFLSKINASRSAAGLAPVSMHSDLVPDARNHSAEMMAAGQIFHSSNLGSVASGWEALAENVGAGPSVASLHTAFMNSAGHRANILGNYNHVGVGVVTEGDLIWVTVIFMRKGSVPEPTTTTTTTTAAPVTTTTTTTAPTVTTTTNPHPPGPGSEPTTTTTAPTTNSSAAPVSDQPAETANVADLESEPSREMQNSAQALHLPIAD